MIAIASRDEFPSTTYAANLFEIAGPTFRESENPEDP
jgi:hypothetical protein